MKKNDKSDIRKMLTKILTENQQDFVTELKKLKGKQREDANIKLMEFFISRLK
jgi:hypothetical protein